MRPLRLAWMLSAALACGADRSSIDTDAQCIESFVNADGQWWRLHNAYHERCTGEDSLWLGPPIDGCLDGCRVLDCFEALETKPCEYEGRTVQECLDAVGWYRGWEYPGSTTRSCDNPIPR